MLPLSLLLLLLQCLSKGDHTATADHAAGAMTLVNVWRVLPGHQAMVDEARVQMAMLRRYNCSCQRLLLSAAAVHVDAQPV